MEVEGEQTAASMGAFRYKISRLKVVSGELKSGQA